jgi:hypothetical protein
LLGWGFKPLFLVNRGETQKMGKVAKMIKNSDKKSIEESKNEVKR